MCLCETDSWPMLPPGGRTRQKLRTWGGGGDAGHVGGNDKNSPAFSICSLHFLQNHNLCSSTTI